VLAHKCQGIQTLFGKTDPAGDGPFDVGMIYQEVTLVEGERGLK
jgi:hypothetical protein